MQETKGTGVDPWVGRSPGGGNGNPLWYSRLVGNAAGLSWTATQGIVSAKARDVYDDTGYAIQCLQVDVAINSGNSGGPLLNKQGMFKKSCGRIEDRRRDAHSIISEGFSVGTKNRFLHYDFKNLDNYIKRYNWYATREMQDYIDFTRGAQTDIKTDKEILKQRKKKFGFYYKMPRYFRAWMWFIYNYIFRGGFLDGKEGLVFTFLECYWYRLLVDAKILEYEKTGGEFEKLKAID